MSFRRKNYTIYIIFNVFFYTAEKSKNMTTIYVTCYVCFVYTRLKYAYN